MRPSYYVLAAAAALTLSGCALTRSTVDLTVPLGNEQARTEKAYVRIVQIADQREFQLNPTDPSIPSLAEEDINNAAVKARAIARKRNTFGQALGDVLLPEGRTVAQVVREAATKALRERGYAVVDEKSAATSNATPLTVGVQKFWSWVTPGFAAVTLTFEAEVALQGPMIATEGGTVRARTEDQFQIVTEGAQQEFMQRGLNELVERMKAAVRAP